MTADELSAHNIVCKFPYPIGCIMDKHSGFASWLGAILAIYGAVTQPSVVAQVPGAVGHALGAIGAFSPAVTATIGVIGAVIAARSMPSGSAKSSE